MKEVNLRICQTILALLVGLFFSAGVCAQQLTVKGTVKDQAGEPVIGANVLVKGATQGVITDLDGRFELKAAMNSVLVVSYVGYLPQEVPVKGSAVNVVLKEDNALLEEVVVIGYGTSRKEDLSTSVSTVKVDQAMKSRPANLGSFIQGQMPGVMVNANGGDPLAKQSLSIRGRGSRGEEGDPSTGDAVLYVVDGVPNAPFNMEDVESITILKDAASAAIYGASVGSGGVVIVTTKQAQSGKVKVSFNLSKSIKSAWKLPTALTSEQYNKVWADAIKAYGGDLPVVADPTRYAYGAVTRTDWIDEVFRTGQLDHYAVSLSGGSDAIKAFASLSYDKDQGIIENTYSNKLGARMQIDFQLSKAVKLSQRGVFQHSNGQGDIRGGHEGVLASAIFFPRSASVYDYDEAGNLMYDGVSREPLYHGTVPRWAAAKGISGYGELRNPLAMLRRLDQKRPSSTIYSTTSLEVKPISALTIKSDFTAGLTQDRVEEFIYKIEEPGRPNPKNERNIGRSVANNWIWETTASYAQAVDKHHLSLMAGYTMKYDKYQWDKIFTSQYDTEFNRYSHIFSEAGNWSDTKPDETVWEESMISAFVRAGYSFDDRYFLTASLRRDATSKLYKDNNSGFFPALSGSWKISSEPFFGNLKEHVNLLKLRASWGRIGNVSMVPRYSWNAPMGVISWPVIYGKNLDVAIQDGVYAKTISTRNLKWETTEQTGLGLDLGLFNNSLTLTVDYYNKVTRDLIEKLAIPSVAGISEEPYGNVGEVVNRGWEFSANYTRKVGDWTFALHGNLATVHNEVKSMGQREYMAHGNTINSVQPLRSAINQPWYSYYLLKTDGIFQTEEEVNNYKWKNPETGISNLIQPHARPGDLKYVDTNNDGQINDEDKQYLGSFLPQITYGFGGNAAWKGFDLSVLFQGVAKTSIYNGFKQMGLTGRMQNHNMLSDLLEAWDYNKNSGIPRLALAKDPNGNYTNASDFFLENGSYLRLKNVTLGYTLPKTAMLKLGMPTSTLRFYLSGENLLTMTKYSGFDPEVGNYGLDGGVYPMARTWSFGLNFSF